MGRAPPFVTLPDTPGRSQNAAQGWEERERKGRKRGEVVRLRGGTGKTGLYTS